ncbi:MAG: HNH endonuclease [Flavobacteriaceae bacterium]|nr:HNH endonuclease [Flavobacteriaceae bacterium]
MFKEGIVYKRSTIHDQYGGNRQSGISPSAKHPYIFIFTGTEGKQYGYKDRWENNNVFSYTGEGQVGDMQFTKGNLALLEHHSSKKKVFLFKYISKGFVEFVSEVEAIDFDFFETKDRNGALRQGIKFFFKRNNIRDYDIPDQLNYFNESREKPFYKKPNRTERKGLITSRVGQGAYRKSILHRWEYKCAASGYRNTEILIASHIHPWSKANDDERLDVDNGILLSPDYDALFDKHLISFENTGKIILGDRIASSDYIKLGINGSEKIKNISQGNVFYLERHRELLV